MLRRSISSLALFLASCAGSATSGGYPSLAKRPIESGVAVSQPVTPPEQAAPDPALDADIGRLKEQSQRGATRFDQAYPRAQERAKAAARAAVSSEAWVAAQGAISELEAARNDSVSALAALDTLYVTRVDAVANGTAQGGAEATDAARREALAVVDAQNDKLDALKAMMPAA